MPREARSTGWRTSPISTAMPTLSSDFAHDGNSLWGDCSDGFPLTDLTATKRRPDLVISRSPPPGPAKSCDGTHGAPFWQIGEDIAVGLRRALPSPTGRRDGDPDRHRLQSRRIERGSSGAFVSLLHGENGSDRLFLEVGVRRFSLRRVAAAREAAPSERQHCARSPHADSPAARTRQDVTAAGVVPSHEVALDCVLAKQHRHGIVNVSRRHVSVCVHALQSLNQSLFECVDHHGPSHDISGPFAQGCRTPAAGSRLSTPELAMEHIKNS